MQHILNVTHQGPARDAASVHFRPSIRRTDMLVLETKATQWSQRVTNTSKTVLDRGSRWDRPRYCVTTPIRAERSQSDGRTDGQTDDRDCFSFPANAVGNYGHTVAGHKCLLCGRDIPVYKLCQKVRGKTSAQRFDALVTLQNVKNPLYITRHYPYKDEQGVALTGLTGRNSTGPPCSVTVEL